MSRNMKSAIGAMFVLFLLLGTSFPAMAQQCLVGRLPSGNVVSVLILADGTHAVYQTVPPEQQSVPGPSINNRTGHVNDISRQQRREQSHPGPQPWSGVVPVTRQSGVMSFMTPRGEARLQETALTWVPGGGVAQMSPCTPDQRRELESHRTG